jgi:hypothetical protein
MNKNKSKKVGANFMESLELNTSQGQQFKNLINLPNLHTSH